MITLRRLNAAVSDVQDELIRLGFWDDKMYAVDVFLVATDMFAPAYGWKWNGRSGDIAIPAVSMLRLRDWFYGNYTSLRGVLRHEYGHAVADTHYRMTRCAEFRDVFGGSYDGEYEEDDEWDTDEFISSYASTRPCEDFAETFQLYVTRGGKLPHYHRKRPIIRRKWNFIDRMRKAIKAGRSSF